MASELRKGINRSLARLAFLVLLVFVSSPWLRSTAQQPLSIYADHLVNGFQDWSWGTRNLSDTNTVHSGINAISASLNAWEALSVYHADLSTALYTNLSFWANGGTNGGQRLQIYANYGSIQGPAVAIVALTANTWRQYSVALSRLGADNISNLNRLTFQLTGSGTTNTFYVDDVQLTSKPAPLVHVTIDATHPLRAVDSRWFGVNAAVWDGNFDKSTTITFLRDMGTRIMRFPGGSLSDVFHWRSNYISGSNPWQGSTWFTNFAHVATNIGAQAFITVNYGSGTAAEAAAWVRYSNLTNRYGFKYWEIGNENYGTWEFDFNTNAPYRPNDGWTYATRAADYFQQMKTADPTIKIGVVATPGEDSSVNGNTTHGAYNPRTGQTHYGWTPVLLTTLQSLGVTPDFIVHHRYPEWTDANNPVGSDSDAFLLQCSTAWAGDAADLRLQISDYFGPPGTNIELVCTENNSDAGAQGRQSTSLVNGLYYADSLAQLMKTEFNAFVWWDLRNATDTGGCFDSTLYGWRTYGDLGMINGLSTRLPTFYAAKLMQYLAQTGDIILSSTSDYPLLSAYAARRASGAVSLLVINKDPATNFTAQLNLTGFVPAPASTVRAYGIPQDEAARTNAPLQAQDIATNTFMGTASNFTSTFPPLSLTLLTLPPTPPTLTVVPPSLPGGQFVVQLQGQQNVRYVLQRSPNLVSWSGASTNTLSTATMNFTNPLPPGSGPQFWRALWQP